MVDSNFPGVRRIVWAFPGQNTNGVGPVVDVNSPDIACRANAQRPALRGVARAGSEITFDWSNYFTVRLLDKVLEND